MIKEYIKGSILDAPQKYIAHGCNAQNRMGSGVAKVLFDVYPEVKERYHNFCSFMVNQGYRSQLIGSGDPVDCGDRTVYNLITQEYFGYDRKLYVSYDAIFKSFEFMKVSGVREVAIPKIGCGLAGGNWEIVSRIIDDATGDDLDVYVYYLEDK